MTGRYISIYSEDKLIGLFPERMYNAAKGSISSNIGRKYDIKPITPKDAKEKAKEMGLEGKLNEGFAFFKP